MALAKLDRIPGDYNLYIGGFVPRPVCLGRSLGLMQPLSASSLVVGHILTQSGFSRCEGRRH